MDSSGLLGAGAPALVGAIVLLGVLFILYHIFSGGIPGTRYYHARRLRDLDPQVRQSTIHELLDRGAVYARSLLIEALEYGDVNARAAIIEALGRLGDANVIEILLRFLSDRNGIIQVKAIEALGHFPGHTVDHAFLEILPKSEPRAQQLILNHFRDGHDPAIVPVAARLVPKADDELIDQLTLLLHLDPPSALEALARLLPEAGDGALKLIKVMSSLDRRAAIEPFKEVFPKAQSVAVQREILRELIASGDPDLAEFLLPFAADPDCPARMRVIEAFSALNDGRAIVPLCKLCTDLDPMVRRQVSKSIMSLAQNAPLAQTLQSVFRVLNTEPIEVRRFASSLLGRLGGVGVLRAVVRFLWDEKATEIEEFLEGMTGHPMSRFTTLDEVLFEIDRLDADGRATEQAQQAIDLLWSLLIVMYGSLLRGHQLDDRRMEFLVHGHRGVYAGRVQYLHPLSRELLEFVSSKVDGDRWRATSPL